jgi:uncharacterized iron-regulated membrane protein
VAVHVKAAAYSSHGRLVSGSDAKLQRLALVWTVERGHAQDRQPVRRLAASEDTRPPPTVGYISHVRDLSTFLREGLWGIRRRPFVQAP